MRKHWKKLALILGCSMLLVGQVPVRVYAEEAQVADVKAKPEVPTNITLTNTGKISFISQSEQTTFVIEVLKKEGSDWKKVGKSIETFLFVSKGTEVKNSCVDHLNDFGPGQYKIRVQAIMKGVDDPSAWGESNEMEWVKKQQLPTPEVLSKSLDENQNPHITVSELDGYKLGQDYEFEYKLVFAGAVFDTSTSHGVTCDDLGSVSDKNHWVEVRAKSLNGDKFSDSKAVKIYFYGEKPDVPSESTSNSSGDGCSHNYEWETVTEATDTQDGREAYRCTRCGHVKAHMEVANSAYAQFNKNAIASIDRAPLNGTVTLRTNKWVSFYDDVIETLKGRPDVTVVVKYFYEGTHYAMTIPAGADLSALAESEGYYGFRYLDTFFPGKVE